MNETDFLVKEVRSDFLVTKSRKLLWKLELDMLVWLESICNKYNINYFLIGGSEIGAVRHKGFIPWDDDIDLGMLRKDFNKFLEVCSREIPNFYEIQYRFSNGRDCWSNLCRIRDSRTTGIINNQIGKNISHGVFIEIYPYDYVPLSRRKQIRLANKINILINVLLDKINQVPVKGIRMNMWKILFFWASPERIDRRIDSICQSFNDCGVVSTTMIPQYLKSGAEVLDKDDVVETIKVPFEYTTVRIPKQYHKCLTRQYGNYMELPPIEQRGRHHSLLVFYDPERPYTEYLGKSTSELIEKYGFMI